MPSDTAEFLDLFRKGQSLQRERSPDVATAVLAEALGERYDTPRTIAEGVAKDILVGDPSSFTHLRGATSPSPPPILPRLSKSVILKSDDPEGPIIYGPASVEIVDKENEVITGKALREALPQLLRRSTFSLEHMDIVVGKILPSAEVDGTTYDTEVRKVTKADLERFPKLKDADVSVGDEAMFVVGRLYKDNSFSEETVDDVLKGELDSFSISGKAVSESRKMDCEGFECKLVNTIDKVDLSAVTLCADGMNQGASFVVLRKSWLENAPWTKTSKSATAECGCGGRSGHGDPFASLTKQLDSVFDSSNSSTVNKMDAEDGVKELRRYVKDLGLALEQEDLEEIESLAAMVRDHADRLEEQEGIEKAWVPGGTSRTGSTIAVNTETGDKKYGEEAERLLSGQSTMGSGRETGAQMGAAMHGADPGEQRDAFETAEQRAAEQRKPDKDPYESDVTFPEDVPEAGGEGQEIQQAAHRVAEEHLLGYDDVDRQEISEQAAAIIDELAQETGDVREVDVNDFAQRFQDFMEDQFDESVDPEVARQIFGASLDAMFKADLAELDAIIKRGGQPEDDAEEHGLPIGNPEQPSGHQTHVTPSDAAATNIEWGEDRDYVYPEGSDRLDGAPGPWNVGERQSGHEDDAEIEKADVSIDDDERIAKPAPEGVDPEAYDSCVAQVTEAGDAENAHAVCAVAMKSGHAPTFETTVAKARGFGLSPADAHRAAFAEHGFSDHYRRKCATCLTIAKSYEDPDTYFAGVAKALDTGREPIGMLAPADRVHFKHEIPRFREMFPLTAEHQMERTLERVIA